MRYAAAAKTMAPLLGETLLHAYRIHLRERIRQAVITEAEVAEGRLSGSDEVTIAFADLVGFTRLGETLEIEQIGDLTGRLFELASDAARSPVRLVKMIGDAAMFASPESGPLLDAVLSTGRIGARRGVSRRCERAWRAVRRSAAGVTGTGARSTWPPGSPTSPRPDSVVIDQSVKDSIGRGRRPAFDFSFAGKRRFKGIEGEVPVHRVRRAAETRLIRS